VTRRIESCKPCCLALFLAVLVLTLAGCTKSPSRGPGSRRLEGRKDDLFGIAIGNLNRLEEYDTNEMLKQCVDRLNQWVQEQPPRKGWKVDPMVASLPGECRDLPVMKVLDKREFRISPPAADGSALQEAVMLRGVSNWARGDQVEDLSRAKCLFDWTIRNIQIEPERFSQPGTPARVLQTPWETLLLGRGTAAERAWVFILLARQQGLDAALLMPTEMEEAVQDAAGPWLVGVLSKGEVYLFDTQLGLPIPSGDGKRLDEHGQLDLEPATLSQVVANDNLLRQLDADLEHPYPLKASQLKSARVLLEASPAYLSQRMKILEASLAGTDRLVLATDPTAEAGRFKRCPHVAGARLWIRPYEVALQERQLGQERLQWQLLQFMPFQIGAGHIQTLFKGRLYHLKGRFGEDPNAITYYQMSRISNRQMDDASVSPEERVLYLRAKLDASYWLGLIAADQNNPRSAEDYFTTRTLDVVANNLWVHGLKYNLARVYEASGKTKQAIELYRSDAQSPGYRGNLLRARWLESSASKATPGPDRGSP
jgi:hypothetical protein